MSSTSPEVVKWFTRARRFPQLIGRTPDGARLWGGPYTVTQVVGAGVTLFLGTQTMGLWAHHGLLGNAGVLLGVTYGLVLALGRIPVGSRNPLSVTAGIGRALAASTTGTLAGRPVKLARPHHVRHRIVVLQTPAVAPKPAPAPQPAAAAAPAPSIAPATAGMHKPHGRPPAASARRRTTRPATVPAADVDQVSRSTPPAPSAPALSGVQALLASSPTPAPTAPRTPASSAPSPAAPCFRPAGSRLVEDL